MNKQEIQKIRTEYKKLRRLQIISLILIGLAFLILLNSSNSSNNEFDELYKVIVCFMLGSIGMALLTKTDDAYFLKLQLKLLTEEQSELVVEEIESYMEFEIKIDDAKYEAFTVFTKNSQWTFDSSENYDYKSLKNKLTKGKTKKKYKAEKPNRWEALFPGILFVLLGVFLLIVFITDSISNFNTLPVQVAKLEGVVLNKIEIPKTESRSNQRLIKIELEAYPRLTFRLGEVNLSSSKFDELNNKVKKGDKVEIEIQYEDFQKNIIERRSINTQENSSNQSIQICGIKDETNTYLDVMEYYKDKKPKTDPFKASLIFLSLIGYGIYRIRKDLKVISEKV